MPSIPEYLFPCTSIFYIFPLFIIILYLYHEPLNCSLSPSLATPSFPPSLPPYPSLLPSLSLTIPPPNHQGEPVRKIGAVVSLGTGLTALKPIAHVEIMRPNSAVDLLSAAKSLAAGANLIDIMVEQVSPYNSITLIHRLYTNYNKTRKTNNYNYLKKKKILKEFFFLSSKLKKNKSNCRDSSTHLVL